VNDAPAPAEPTAGPRRVRPARQRWLGRGFRLAVSALAAGTVVLVVALGLLLASGAQASIERFGWGFVTGSVWDVPTGVYGAWPALVGTLVVSALALLFAVPVAFGVALFSSEFAPRRLRGPLAYFVDLGAAIPSVVYGFWALVVLVPFLRGTIEPGLGALTGRVGPFAGTGTGEDVLAAAVVLAVMIVPTIAALSREALRAVPRELREGALAVGATRWEATRLTVVGPAAPGLVGAVILGLGRAIGETIAVALVIGNGYVVPTSLFSKASTIPSWLVNRFFESYGLTRSALYELALLLLLVSIAINVGARLLVRGLERWARRPRRRAARVSRATAAPDAPPSSSSPPGPLPAWWRRVAAARPARLRRRRAVNAAAAAMLAGAVALAAYPLVSLLATAVANGGRAVVTPSFYTSAPPLPCGVGQTSCPIGGVGPMIEGTLILVGLAAAVAVPVGILVGVFLSEYARSRLSRSAAVAVDVLASTPSILIGIFVFTVFLRFDRFDDQSAFAGAGALAVLMVPIVAKASEAALRTVPAAVREGALALGFPRHRVTTRVVLGSCRGPLVTGSLLAAMRAGGETAAVLLTAGTSLLWITNLNAQTPSLATFIFEALTVYTSPNYQTDAWGAALVLLLIMAVASLAARLVVRSPDGSGSA
jgi:phosphate transport system permease protein